MLPSGKHTKNDGKIHHAIHGKTHYFYGDFPYATNYQRVYGSNFLSISFQAASLEVSEESGWLVLPAFSIS
jgi:hypothetical protein